MKTYMSKNVTQLLLLILFVMVCSVDVSCSAEPTFTVSIESASSQRIGNPIVVNITITNTSNQDFVFYDVGRIDFDTSIVVWRSSGLTVEKTIYGMQTPGGPGSFALSTLHPGGQDTVSATINKVYDMTAPGTYFIRVDVSMMPSRGRPLPFNPTRSP
jgi:hypothetical protein